MSLPNLHFLCSTPFLNAVFRLSREQIDRLWESSRPLREMVDSTKPRMLDLISRYSGGTWGERDIHIYLIPGNARMPSMSAPFLLKVREDLDVTFFILVHELVHRYLSHSPELSGMEERYHSTHVGQVKGEAIVDLVAKRVCSLIIGLERTAGAIERMSVFVTTVNMREVSKLLSKLESQWNLEKMPLVHWLK